MNSRPQETHRHRDRKGKLPYCFPMCY